MSNVEDVRNSESEPIVERGKEYDHADHGRVKVTGIWKGVHQVDTAQNMDETGVVIVRYSTNQGDQQFDVNGLTDTLDEFIASTE